MDENGIRMRKWLEQRVIKITILGSRLVSYYKLEMSNVSISGYR